MRDPGRQGAFSLRVILTEEQGGCGFYPQIPPSSLVEGFPPGQISSLELSTYPPDHKRTSAARRKKVPKQRVTDAPAQTSQPLGIQVNAKEDVGREVDHEGPLLLHSAPKQIIHPPTPASLGRGLRCHKRHKRPRSRS